MEKPTFQFVAAAVGGGAVARDGHEIMLEFESDGERLWLSLPSAVLPQLAQLTRALDALSADARNGVANCWHACNDGGCAS